MMLESMVWILEATDSCRVLFRCENRVGFNTVRDCGSRFEDRPKLKPNCMSAETMNQNRFSLLAQAYQSFHLGKDVTLA